MLQAFVRDGTTVRWLHGEDAAGALPPDTVWVDLLTPGLDELERAQDLIGVPLPSREQMTEIEESSRLRRIPGGLHVTVLTLAFLDTDSPKLAPVSFVLARGRLVTIHHMEPQPLLTIRRRVLRGQIPSHPEAAMTALVEAMVERTAAALRRTGIELDSLSGHTFRDKRLTGSAAPRDDLRTIKRLGQAGHLIAKTHESLASIARMLDFVARGQMGDGIVGKDTRRWARGALMNVTALDEYARFLSGKVGLLLDTTLGQVNVQQNEIVKIVSVLTVVLFPPLLVTSVFGMNIHTMPEKHWIGGYPMALLLTVLSALVPVWFFRRRGWL